MRFGIILLFQKHKALVGKIKRHRPRTPQVPPYSFENVFEFLSGTIAVIGCHLNQYGNTGRTEAFIGHLVQGSPARPRRNGPFDIGLGHTVTSGLIDNHPEFEVKARVGSATGFNGNGDFPGHLGEDLSFLGIVGFFLSFNGGVMRMSGHISANYTTPPFILPRRQKEALDNLLPQFILKYSYF